MTNQKKKKRSKVEAAPSKPESSSEIAESIAVESLTAVRDEIRGIVSKKIKPKGHDPASRIAWLASRASAISAEQRKAQALEHKRIDAITPAMVLAWFRGLEQEERQQLVTEIEQIDLEGSVLG